MYLNSEFYAKHLFFVKVMKGHSGVFNNVDTLLALSVSNGALDSIKPNKSLWKKKHSIFVVHLNDQVCACFYLQFACVLITANFKSYNAMLKY